MPNLISRDHAEDVEYAVKVWEDALADNISVLLEGGEIPGVRELSKAELREFFDTTSASYWTALAISDPDEAWSQLRQFEQVGDGAV